MNEEIFCWVRTIGGFRKTRFIVLERTNVTAKMVEAAYNIMGISTPVAKRIAMDVEKHSVAVAL